MSDKWEAFTEDLATELSRRVIARVQASLERFMRDSVKLIYSEREAAAFLGVTKEKLQAWRKRKLISASRYPKGRLREDEKDGLGEVYGYDLASLLSFHQRYLVQGTAPDEFEIKHELEPLGAEIQETRRLRAVGGSR